MLKTNVIQVKSTISNLLIIYEWLIDNIGDREGKYEFLYHERLDKNGVHYLWGVKFENREDAMAFKLAWGI